ncbi:serine hydrolase domain-containing protein [uncultured Imperialibacter sp.]|uniref:serine hydrolase domain-containing protein n=1 Tax=uncultured Imperialibacter sp. TaxID=1672639 RepID=UPI0030DD3C1E|tara:strand:- start:6658 stop:8532 length:1875 start_codon:yes stop_codon:yes gene_type:complete
MKHAFELTVALVFSVLVAKAQPSGTPLTPRQLTDSLEVLMERNDIPGIMLTIVKDDSTIFSGGLGVKDKGTNSQVDGSTLFRLGSITKSFVALGVLRLVEEGKFSLEDEVKALAPEIDFENSFEPEHPVRVKHLLSHTAGFDDMHLNEVYNTSDTVVYPLRKVLEQHMKTLKVRWQPGTRYAYSNPGWTVAGYLIEKYAEQPYDEFITETVLNPIGMKTSNFKSVPEGQAYSKGYDGTGNEVPFLPIYHRPAGAFNSNADDMARFLSFWINRGRVDSAQVFPSKVLELMEAPAYTIANQAGLPVGYGLGNYTFDTQLPASFHGHDGGIDGFSSSYGYNSQYGIGYSISNNAGKGMGDLVNLVKQFLVQDVSVAKPATQALDVETMKQYEGYYLFKASRNQIFAFIDRIFSTCEVTIDNDTLYLKQFMKDRFPVLPVANPGGEGYLFAGLKDYVPSHVFVPTNKGEPVLATAVVGNYLERVKYSSVLTKRVLLVASLVLLVSSCFATLVWLIFAIRKSLAWQEFLRRMVPSLVVVGLIMIATGLFGTINKLSEAGEPNVNGWLIYLGGWIILFSAFLSTRFGIMNFKLGEKKAFSVYYILLAFSCVIVTLFLYDAGWMGLKVWEY